MRIRFSIGPGPFDSAGAAIGYIFLLLIAGSGVIALFDSGSERQGIALTAISPLLFAAVIAWVLGVMEKSAKLDWLGSVFEFLQTIVMVLGMMWLFPATFLLLFAGLSSK